MTAAVIRRTVISLLALSVPLMIFLTVHQVYSYQVLEQRVREMKEEQADLFEKNKRMIANIAIMSSPARIEEIAREKLELESLDSEKKLRIIVKRRTRPKEGGDG